MKVLCLIDTLEVGGAERSLLEICRHLDHTEVVVCHLYPGAAQKPAYRAAGLRVLSLDLAGKYALQRGTRALAEVARAEEPDLLHATLFRAGLVARLTVGRLKLPLIDSFVNDSYSPRRYAELAAGRRLKLRLVQAADRRSQHRVSKFIAISETVKRSNCRALRVEVDRVKVIPRGRCPDDFRTDPDAAAVARRALGLGERTTLLLNVGRLLPRKGQGELVAAMQEVVSKNPSAHLAIAGEGSERPALEAKIHALHLGGQVSLLGQRDDVPELLAAADVFCFPSHWEGHGGALVEAMMAGKPIVAADTAVHRESLEHDKTAILVEDSCPRALAEGILDLVRQPAMARALGARARRVALQRFDVRKIAADHEELFEKVVSRHSAGR